MRGVAPFVLLHSFRKSDYFPKLLPSLPVPAGRAPTGERTLSRRGLAARFFRSVVVGFSPAPPRPAVPAGDSGEREADWGWFLAQLVAFLSQCVVVVS